MGIVEKIKEIEAEMARTQKNKATEYHLGQLKAKIAKLRTQLLEPPPSRSACCHPSTESCSSTVPPAEQKNSYIYTHCRCHSHHIAFTAERAKTDYREEEMAKSPETELPLKAFGWAARDTSATLSPFHFSRRENGDDDVTLKILFCGVCHSDLHTIQNDWGFTTYPVVPGHEIVGVVTKTGNNVKKFRVGDKVGVGVIVESCQACENCCQDLENYCPQPVFTYNSPYKGTRTQGGYSDFVVVHQRYVLQFPENLPLDAGAPLLCAGITVFSPMKYYGMTEPGKHLGVAGLGGLGHVAIKFGKAFGLKVTVISTSPNKESEAIDRLGADSFLVSKDPEKMKAAMGTMDYIIDTISAVHSLMPLLGLLKLNGKLVTVGLPGKPLELPIFPLVAGRKLIGGSNFGGLKETQEMLDFCGKHNITADIELIKMDQINTAMERLSKADVKYRFVIDVANSFSSL